MMVRDVVETDELICEIVGAVRCKKCWYVDIGGFAEYTFSLHLGKKIRRPSPIGKDHTQIALYDGEINFYVWCAWRLDGLTAPISSWDDNKTSIMLALGQLKGETVVDTRIDLPSWDLHLIFSNCLTLHVFCDHVPGSPSYSGNWDVRFKGNLASFGPGAEYTVEKEESWWKKSSSLVPPPTSQK